MLRGDKRMIEIDLQKLDRGIKMEWRTVTRGGKTFRQRFRVGKKDNTKTITNFETKIRDQDFETAGIFDDNGKLILEKNGETDRVVFTKEEIDSFEGMTLTHNHPKGDSFSPMDLKFACAGKMKEMRVTSRRNGKTFILRASDGSNMRPELWDDNNDMGITGLGFIVGTYDDDVRYDFRSRIQSGDMTVAEADGSHWQEVWKRVTENDDRIIYEEV